MLNNGNEIKICIHADFTIDHEVPAAYIQKGSNENLSAHIYTVHTHTTLREIASMEHKMPSHPTSIIPS